MLGFVFLGFRVWSLCWVLVIFWVAVVSCVFNLNMTFLELWAETCVHVLVFLLFLVDSFEQEVL